MKKSFVLIFVLICAALSVLSVSAAPRDRYYDQLGNKHWCNSDSYGCWVTGENGEHEYIMFWSESARDAIMGPDSNAPIGTNPGTSELTLAAPKPVISTSSGGAANTCTGETKDSASCANYCQQTTGSSEHTFEGYPFCKCTCLGGGCTSDDDCIDYCKSLNMGNPKCFSDGQCGCA